MNIKTLICLLPVLASACNSQLVPGDYAGRELIEFSLDCSSVQVSKATSSGAENVLSNVQIAVYSPAGFLCASGRMSAGSLSLSVPVESAGYTVAALVNSPENLEGYSSASSLSGIKSSLLDNTDANALEMYGVASNVTFHKGETCTVPVTRFAAKVEIDKIVNMIPTKPEFILKGIYLINVNTASDVSGNATSPVWYQKRRFASSETNVVKYTSDIFTSNLAYGASYSTPHYFYCYANPTTVDTSSPTWSPRFTRLVVEATYNGITYYYPVNIVGSQNTLESATSYIITQMTVTGPGSTDPDVPISKGNASFSITVKDWLTGFSQTVTY